MIEVFAANGILYALNPYRSKTPRSCILNHAGASNPDTGVAIDNSEEQHVQSDNFEAHAEDTLYEFTLTGDEEFSLLWGRINPATGDN